MMYGFRNLLCAIGIEPKSFIEIFHPCLNKKTGDYIRSFAIYH
jgi:hypothetical protein